MSNVLVGNEKVQVFGNRANTFVPFEDAVADSKSVAGKVDKSGVHKYLNSNEIRSWFNTAVNLDFIDAGVHFINADNGMTSNAPSSGIYKIEQFEIEGYVLQEAERFSTGERYSRAKVGTMWGGWNLTGGKEVTPPSDLPVGKEGQMLEYRSGKWVATSPMEISSNLHINHDSHLDFQITQFREVGVFNKEEEDKLNWVGLTSGVEMTAIWYEGTYPYMCLLLRPTNGERILAGIAGTGSNSPRLESLSFNYQKHIYQNQATTQKDIYLGSIHERGKPCGSFLDATLKLEFFESDRKPEFFDLKLSRLMNSMDVYVKLRKRRDFPAYYEPVDPEPPVET